MKVLLILAAITGLCLTIYGGRKKHQLEKYEFENKTDGGVVQFSDFKESNKHTNKKTFAQILSSVGFFILVISIISLFAIW